MKIALLGASKERFNLVFSPDVMEKLSQYGEVSSELINKANIGKHKEFLSDCTVAFSTWGMPCFSEDEIKEYMPKLGYLFYAAGSVQSFARPFLDCGVRVFSAFAANAVPVAEYTVSQIVLAAKGFYQGAKRCRIGFPAAVVHTKKSQGCFDIKVGLAGLGCIGSMVAERLKDYDVQVLAFDPFCSAEKAEKLGVTLVDLETLFRECHIVSNHLANKKELKNVFTGKHFRLMPKYSTFINTGRGDQVSEWALALNLILHPSKTAVLDVLKKEYLPYINPLFWCPNAIITPHIAGSMGNETHRMAYYMIQQLDNCVSGKETQYEVTKEMLSTMA